MTKPLLFYFPKCVDEISAITFMNQYIHSNAQLRKALYVLISALKESGSTLDFYIREDNDHYTYGSQYAFNGLLHFGRDYTVIRYNEDSLKIFIGDLQ